MDLPPPPPEPGAPPFPEGPGQARRSTGRRLVLVAAIVMGAIGSVAIVALVAGGGDGFPDTVLGYERLHGGSAQAAEDVMESIKIADLEISAAVYGESGTPRLVAVLYGNYPQDVDIQQIVDGMSFGMEQSGGSVDRSSLQTVDGDGYRFACVEAGGPGMLVPGGPDEDGVACVFHGSTTGLIITTHSSISIQGLQDVRAFVDAYESA